LPAGPNPRSQLQGAVVVAAHLTFLRRLRRRLSDYCPASLGYYLITGG
jgi:hypothetical protein